MAKWLVVRTVEKGDDLFVTVPTTWVEVEEEQAFMYYPSKETYKNVSSYVNNSVPPQKTWNVCVIEAIDHEFENLIEARQIENECQQSKKNEAWKNYYKNGVKAKVYGFGHRTSKRNKHFGDDSTTERESGGEASSEEGQEDADGVPLNPKPGRRVPSPPAQVTPKKSIEVNTPSKNERRNDSEITPQKAGKSSPIKILSKSSAQDFGKSVRQSPVVKKTPQVTATKQPVRSSPRKKQNAKPTQQTASNDSTVSVTSSEQQKSATTKKGERATAHDRVPVVVRKSNTPTASTSKTNNLVDPVASTSKGNRTVTPALPSTSRSNERDEWDSMSANNDEPAGTPRLNVDSEILANDPDLTNETANSVPAPIVKKIASLIIRKHNMLMEQIQIVHKKLDEIAAAGPDRRSLDQNVPRDLPVALPCTTSKQLLRVNKFVKEDKKLNGEMVQFLSTLPSNEDSRRTSVNTMLKRLMTNAVAIQFSWAGTEDKYDFKGLTLPHIINAAVSLQEKPQMSYKNVSEDIGIWLRQAKNRIASGLGRRARNGGNRPAKRKRPTEFEDTASELEDNLDD